VEALRLQGWRAMQITWLFNKAISCQSRGLCATSERGGQIVTSELRPRPDHFKAKARPVHDQGQTTSMPRPDLFKTKARSLHSQGQTTSKPRPDLFKIKARPLQCQGQTCSRSRPDHFKAKARPVQDQGQTTSMPRPDLFKTKATHTVLNTSPRSDT